MAVGDAGVQVACDPLLAAMAAAGVRRCVVVLGHGKWDVPAFLGDGARHGLDLAYLTIADSPSTPATLDRAYEHVRGCRVVLGFPDILVSPPELFRPLLAVEADVVLALFDADDPTLVDMVDVDADGVVRAVVPKPAVTGLRLAWLAAVWGPAFTELLHDGGPWGAEATERYVGDVVQDAIDAGLRVRGVRVEGGRYRDVGTRASLADQWGGAPRPTATN